MKIFVICSKHNYGLVPELMEKLKIVGHKVTIPNCMYEPDSEAKAKAQGAVAHIKFKQEMYKNSRKKIEDNDAVLVFNPGGYIGGATFLEMYEAFILGKDVYMTDEVNQDVFKDEVIGFGPIDSKLLYSNDKDAG